MIMVHPCQVGMDLTGKKNGRPRARFSLSLVAGNQMSVRRRTCFQACCFSLNLPA